MDISRVSLVDKGANKRAFAVLKRDDSVEAPDDDPMSGALELADATPAGLGGFLHGVADRLLGVSKATPDDKAPESAAHVVKASTFASIIAGRELNDALPDAFYTLEDAIWSAIYAHDSSGADLGVAAKEALVGQSLDEFKAYLVGIMASAVGKRDVTEGAQAIERIEAVVAKVGRKISAARLEQLKTAAGALTAVLADVESEADTEAVTKSGSAAEEYEMTSDELTAALKPFGDRLEAIEKRLPDVPAAAAATADGPEADGSGDELTLAGVAEAIGKLAERFDVVEKAATRGTRTSADGQDDSQVKKSQWAGIF